MSPPGDGPCPLVGHPTTAPSATKAPTTAIAHFVQRATSLAPSPDLTHSRADWPHKAIEKIEWALATDAVIPALVAAVEPRLASGRARICFGRRARQGNHRRWVHRRRLRGSCRRGHPDRVTAQCTDDETTVDTLVQVVRHGDQDATYVLHTSSTTPDQLVVPLAGLQGRLGHQRRAPSPAKGNGGRVAEELRTLVELRDAGALTEAEFAAANSVFWDETSTEHPAQAHQRTASA